MSTRLATVAFLDSRRAAGPMHRSIVAVDLEGSTMRTNPVKGELRRTMYNLLGCALEAAAITGNHLERPTDRGDGVLILIRPHDDVPKTVLLGRLIPLLAALLTEYNAEVTQPALRIRLRTVVHAGEVHADDRGFYGEAIDVAIRLLDSAPVKRALRQAASPLVLVVSEEIYSGIVSHGYVDGDTYLPLVRVRVANKRHRGWVHVPGPGHLASADGPRRATGPRVLRSPLLAIAQERVERMAPAASGRLPSHTTSGASGFSPARPCTASAAGGGTPGGCRSEPTAGSSPCPCCRCSTWSAPWPSCTGSSTSARAWCTCAPGRSPADPLFGPFWATVSEAGIPVVFHVSEGGYNDFYGNLWSENPDNPSHRQSPLQWALCHTERPVVDTLVALMLHNLSGRHPPRRSSPRPARAG